MFFPTIVRLNRWEQKSRKNELKLLFTFLTRTSLMVFDVLPFLFQRIRDCFLLRSWLSKRFFCYYCWTRGSFNCTSSDQMSPWSRMRSRDSHLRVSCISVRRSAVRCSELEVFWSTKRVSWHSVLSRATQKGDRTLLSKTRDCSKT